MFGSIRWCVWSFRPSSPLRLPHLKCLLLMFVALWLTPSALPAAAFSLAVSPCFPVLPFCFAVSGAGVASLPGVLPPPAAAAAPPILALPVLQCMLSLERWLAPVLMGVAAASFVPPVVIGVFTPVCEHRQVFSSQQQLFCMTPTLHMLSSGAGQ